MEIDPSLDSVLEIKDAECSRRTCQGPLTLLAGFPSFAPVKPDVIGRSPDQACALWVRTARTTRRRADVQG